MSDVRLNRIELTRESKMNDEEIILSTDDSEINKAIVEHEKRMQEFIENLLKKLDEEYGNEEWLIMNFYKISASGYEDAFI